MIGTYRFLRTRNGVTAFARVELEATPDEQWTLEWSPAARELRAEYEEDVWAGVESARSAHESRGGGPARMVVLRVIESPVDTTSDAMTCAAAKAAWAALGQDQNRARLRHDGVRWIVDFDAIG